MPDSAGATVLDDLPESIIEDILVRLPPKDVLRCRAVRKSWRRATSTDRFLLDHHRRQPSLPIIRRDDLDSRLLVFREGGAGASDGELCTLLRCALLCAACDGLLIVSKDLTQEYICNPAIRKFAPLSPPDPVGFPSWYIVGFYRHDPSGEYRLLWAKTYGVYHRATDYCIRTVGSNQQRCIPWPISSSPDLERLLLHGLPRSYPCPPVRHRGKLHWLMDEGDLNEIVAFDTAAETFELMSLPAWLGQSWPCLLEMDGMLTLFSSMDTITVDVSVMEDYESKTWALKHRINLSLPPNCGDIDFLAMAVLNEREFLMQFDSEGTMRGLMRFDFDGTFLGPLNGTEIDGIRLTFHRLQEMITPLPFCQMQEENVEDSLFIGL